MSAYKFTEETKEKFLELLGKGLSRKAALTELGISRYTLRNHMRSDPDFATQVEDVESCAVEEVEDALYEKALRGHGASIIFYLCNRNPRKWKSVNKLQVEAAGGVTPEEMEHYVEGLIEYCLGFIDESRRADFLDGLAGAGSLPSGGRKSLPASPDS